MRPREPAPVRLRWGMLLFLLACGTPSDSGDSGDSGDPDTGAPWDGPAPLPTELIGHVEVIENPSWGGASVGATIRSGPLPTTQEVVATEGDCVVLSGALTDGWLCEPQCEWGTQSCIDGECVDWPANAPSGDITVTGLVPGTAVLEVLDHGLYGSPGGFDGELFGPGDAIRAASEGGATPAFTLDAVGVADEDFQYTPLESGEDMQWTWTPGDARVELQLETGWHGANALTTIWCNTDDDGELVIPGSLTAYFEIPSCGECAMSSARRLTRDVVDFGAGPLELVVASERSFVAWWGM